MAVAESMPQLAASWSEAARQVQRCQSSQFSPAKNIARIVARVMWTIALVTVLSSSACKCQAPQPHTKTSGTFARSF